MGGFFSSRKCPNGVIISSFVFQNLVSQMEDFEACAEPLQDCLNATEQVVQESSMRLHDLTGKKLELHKLQVLILPICPQHFSFSQPLIFKCRHHSYCHLQEVLT